jgi:hypothetical protein
MAGFGSKLKSGTFGSWQSAVRMLVTRSLQARRSLAATGHLQAPEV